MFVCLGILFLFIFNSLFFYFFFFVFILLYLFFLYWGGIFSCLFFGFSAVFGDFCCCCKHSRVSCELCSCCCWLLPWLLRTVLLPFLAIAVGLLGTVLLTVFGYFRGSCEQ